MAERRALLKPPHKLFNPLRFAALKPPKQFEQSAGEASGQAILQRAFSSKSRKDCRRDFGDMLEV